jgi:hypothetical protein
MHLATAPTVNWQYNRSRATHRATSVLLTGQLAPSEPSRMFVTPFQASCVYGCRERNPITFSVRLQYKACHVSYASTNVVYLFVAYLTTLDRVTARPVSRRLLIAEARVRIQASLCRICGGTETGFAQSTSVLPCQGFG